MGEAEAERVGEALRGAQWVQLPVDSPTLLLIKFCALDGGHVHAAAPCVLRADSDVVPPEHRSGVAALVTDLDAAWLDLLPDSVRGGGVAGGVRAGAELCARWQLAVARRCPGRRPGWRECGADAGPAGTSGSTPRWIPSARMRWC